MGRFETKFTVHIYITEPSVTKPQIEELQKILKGTKEGDKYTCSKDKPIDKPSAHWSIVEDNGSLGFQVYVLDAPAASSMKPTTPPQKKVNIPLIDERTKGWAMIIRSSKSAQNAAYGSLRKPDQTTVMKSSPNVAAEAVGLPNQSWEWLHLVAHRFAKNTDVQVAKNLVLGTTNCNSKMLEYEEAISKAVMFGSAEEAEFDVKAEPIADPSNSSVKYTWLTDKIAYNVKLTYAKKGQKAISKTFDPFDGSKPSKASIIAARFFGLKVLGAP